MVRYHISLMEKGDIEASAKVLSIAMLENPIHVAVYMNSDEQARLEIEKDFNELFQSKPGIVFVVKYDQDIIGVMRMFSCSGKSSGHPPSKTRDENSLEWRRAFWRYEWDRRDPKDQHWHLGPIGVLPEHRGAGVGSMLMERFCKEVDTCQASAFLETDKAINVDFYRKFGFETVLESRIFGVENWYMARAVQ